LGANSLPRLLFVPRFLPAWLHRPLIRFWLRRIRPDIVHSHLNPAARRVGQVATRMRIPHVATLHLGYAPHEHGDCDGLIALNRQQREHVAPAFNGSVAVVWNWLSPTVIEALARTSASDVAELRRTWNANDETIVFGSVGRLDPVKGMDRLVTAFRAVFPDEASVRLVIVGSGPQQDAIARLTAGEPRIVLAGQRSDIARCYKALDIFVSASRGETFGLAIVEAMAAQCPLVLARTDGPAEFAGDAPIRWFEPGDDDALAAALRDAYARSRQHVVYDMAPFSIGRASGEIEAFYRLVMDHRSRPA
jgi:glycosyltransferase involved in cell wall biosynthesis